MDDNKIEHVPLGEREDKIYVEEVSQGIDGEYRIIIYSLSRVPTVEEGDPNSSDENELDSNEITHIMKNFMTLGCKVNNN